MDTAFERGWLETNPSTVRKHFFLKKEAKTFAHLTYAVGQLERLVVKSFCFFFQKEALSCLPGGNPQTAQAIGC
jgi:hypothetical protein